ncbi:hypothetical protein MMUR_26550 [Mycolicibacterium murale]|uniref:Uncharacterized protein n=1 Tax=Mycolicibacterium murale TaxID=182220 RepID=A0A7I9WLP7_9MYCO|nr:hypothetical protein [Mycolicibacterium murale]MCV7181124.1 hypothetical protein [Mycolicibacterium murale]GFG58519.1 hypothetical protein MMUR_26550 [Mycolicibacterium murale]
MPDPARIHSAKVVGRAGGSVTPLQGFDALNQIVAAAKECVAVHQVESTKRARLQTYETTEVERIKRAESVLKDYFTHVFAERRSNFEELFTRLDGALEANDGETVALMVRGIVDIAKSSPLADLGDLSKIRAALDDPDQVWEL